MNPRHTVYGKKLFDDEEENIGGEVVTLADQKVKDNPWMHGSLAFFSRGGARILVVELNAAAVERLDRAGVVLAFGVERGLEGGDLLFGDLSHVADDVPGDLLAAGRSGEGTVVPVVLPHCSLQQLGCGE